MKDFGNHFSKINYGFPMVFVKGTGENTYLFGDEYMANKLN